MSNFYLFFFFFGFVLSLNSILSPPINVGVNSIPNNKPPIIPYIKSKSKTKDTIVPKINPKHIPIE